MLLLNRLEPGFWRDAEREIDGGPVASAPRPVPAARPDAMPAAPSAVAPAPAIPSAPPDAPVRTPAAATVSVPAAPAPPDAAAPPAVASSRTQGPEADTAAGRGTVRPAPAADHGVAVRVAQVHAFNVAGDYGAAWRVARTLPRRDPELLRLAAHTALWAGRGAEAAPLVDALVARRPRDPDARMMQAEVALVTGRPAAAREALSRVRADGLPVAERAHLAGLQEWAGDLAGAQASQEAVLAARPDDPTALRALARVARWRHADALAATTLERLDRRGTVDLDERAWLADYDRRIGDESAARAQWSRLAAAAATPPASPEKTLAAARAAAGLGERTAAASGYARYLAERPDDVAARLEAARTWVNAGEPARALEAYRAVEVAQGGQGLHTEIARTALADGRYAEAETEARLAIADGDDGAETQLALAQSVALQGRPTEAVPLFAAAAAAAPDDPAWPARIAMARDRHLRAETDAADRRADCPTCTPPMRTHLALLEGDAAARRGDFARAAAAYRDAIAGGAMLQGAVAEDRLARALAPGIGMRPVFFGDANGIRLSEGVANGFFWPSPALRLTAQALAGVVEQRDVDYTRTGATIGLDRWYVRPDLELAGRAGFENYAGGGGALAIADASLRKHFDDTSTLTLSGRRESLLTAHDDNEIRAWNRIIDLKRLGPNFAVDGGRLALDQHLRDGVDDRLYAELGLQHYEDGNLRGTGYVHYQLPLDARPGSWTVLRPNGYVEAFKDPDQPAYFSPRTHSAIGTMAHTIQEHGRVRLEAEVNPQMIIGSDGEVAPGGHALVDLSVQVGPARVGIAGFGFWDGSDDYWLWRAMARVEVAFR